MKLDYHLITVTNGSNGSSKMVTGLLSQIKNEQPHNHSVFRLKTRSLKPNTVTANLHTILHFIFWPILISITLLATEGKLIGTWYYEDFVGPAHTLWFLGMWLLGIVPFLIIVVTAKLFKRIIKRPAED